MTVVTMTFSSSDLTNNNDVIALEGWKTSGPFNILPLTKLFKEIFGCVDLANFEAGFLVILKLCGELTS